MAKVGRPKLEIDSKMVQRLAEQGSTVDEIAYVMDVHKRTLERNFAAVIKKGRANLNVSLRGWQIENAKKGNATMQIWLGKQLLGQKEVVEHTMGDNKPKFNMKFE